MTRIGIYLKENPDWDKELIVKTKCTRYTKTKPKNCRQESGAFYEDISKCEECWNEEIYDGETQQEST